MENLVNFVGRTPKIGGEGEGERETIWFASEECGKATAPNTCSSFGDRSSNVAKDDEEWSAIDEIDRSLASNR